MWWWSWTELYSPPCGSNNETRTLKRAMCSERFTFRFTRHWKQPNCKADHLSKTCNYMAFLFLIQVSNDDSVTCKCFWQQWLCNLRFLVDTLIIPIEKQVSSLELQNIYGDLWPSPIFELVLSLADVFMVSTWKSYINLFEFLCSKFSVRAVQPTRWQYPTSVFHA